MVPLSIKEGKCMTEELHDYDVAYFNYWANENQHALVRAKDELEAKLIVWWMYVARHHGDGTVEQITENEASEISVSLHSSNPYTLDDASIPVDMYDSTMDLLKKWKETD